MIINQTSSSKRLHRFAKKTGALFIVALLCLSFLPAQVMATSPPTISQLGTPSSIGGVDGNNNVIFFASVLPYQATAYGTGTQITGNPPNSIAAPSGAAQQYQFFFSNASPNFSVIRSSDPANSSPAGSDVLVLGSLMNTNSQTTSTSMGVSEFINTNDAKVDVSTSFRIVDGLNGKPDMLRLEYTVTNKLTTDQYIGGVMHADTKLGQYGGNATDNALVMVDNPTPFIYNAATNPKGFLSPDGQVLNLCRFVDNGTNDGSYVSGLPMTWRNVMQFNENNPVTAYYSVAPDKATTADHLYPTPNMVQFANWHGSTAPTGGAPSATTPDLWIPISEQRSGQLNAAAGGTRNSVVNYGSGALVSSADSATTIQWNKIKVEPGKSVSFIYFVGQDASKIAQTGGLSGMLSANPNTTFIRNADNSINPLDLLLTLKNSATIDITPLSVKLVYDPSKVKLVQPNGSGGYDDIAPTGTEAQTLNGTSASFAYYSSPSLGTILKTKQMLFPYKVVGINNTMGDLSTYVKAVVEFKDATTNTVTLTTDELRLLVPGKLKLDFQPGFIHVKHMYGSQVLNEYELAGVIGEDATSYALDFVNYQLVSDQLSQRTGVLLKQDSPDFETHVYQYEPRPNPYNLGGVIVQHIGIGSGYNDPSLSQPDYTTPVLLAMEHLHGGDGTAYTAQGKAWPGYQAAPFKVEVNGVEQPLNGSSVDTAFTETPAVVKFYYNYNQANPQGYLDVYENMGRVYVEHRDERDNSLITRDTIIANMRPEDASCEVTANAITVDSYSLADEAQKTTTVTSGGSATVTFKYRQTGYILVRHVDADNPNPATNVLLEEYILGPAGQATSLHSKDFTSYHLAPGHLSTVAGYSFAATLPGPIPEVTFRYVKNAGAYAGDILIRHVDADNAMNVLAVEQVHGKIGTTYTAQAKTIAGFLSGSPTQQTATFADTPTVITFLYPLDTSDPFDINTFPSYSGTLKVEHRDITTHVLIARDTLLADIPLSDTAKEMTANAEIFDNYVLAGPAVQTVSVGRGETQTLTFFYQYSSHGVDQASSPVVYVDLNNASNTWPGDSYVGVPGELVDFSRLGGLPGGYYLADENFGLRVPANGDPIYVYVRMPSNAMSEPTLYVNLLDVRNIANPHLSALQYLQYHPGNPLPPEKTDPLLDIEPFMLPDDDSPADTTPQQEPSSTPEQAPSLPDSTPSSDDDASSEAPPESLPPASIPEASQGADPLAARIALANASSPVQLMAATQFNFEYNYATPYLAGEIHDIDTASPALTALFAPGNPSGYAFSSPASGNIVVFTPAIKADPDDSSVALVVKNVLVHPQMVTLRLTYVNTSGQVVGTSSRSVPWGSDVTNGNAASFLTGTLSSYPVMGIRDKDGVSQSAIVLDERGFYDQAGDYPVTIVVQPPTPNSGNGGNNQPSGNNDNGGSTATPTAPSSSTSKPKPASSSSSSSSVSSSKEANGDSTSASDAAITSENPSPPSSTSGESRSTAPVQSTPSDDGNGPLASLSMVLAAIVAPLATAKGAATAGSLAFLLLLFLLFFMPSSIKITFRVPAGDSEKHLVKRKFFWKNGSKSRLVLDISDKRVLDAFDQCTIDIRFGRAYRRRAENSHLKVTYYNKSASMDIPDGFGSTISFNGADFT